MTTTGPRIQDERGKWMSDGDRIVSLVHTPSEEKGMHMTRQTGTVRCLDGRFFADYDDGSRHMLIPTYGKTIGTQWIDDTVPYQFIDIPAGSVIQEDGVNVYREIDIVGLLSLLENNYMIAHNAMKTEHETKYALDVIYEVEEEIKRRLA